MWPRMAQAAQALLLVSLVRAFDPTPSGTAVRDPNEVVHLHKDNFDDIIASNEEVLVHFHAPWSKRCETIRPILKSFQSSAEWSGRFLHAESDISDGRGYTTYLEHYGVTRLPALVLFRNGHPTLYPPEEPLENEHIEPWLYRTTQSEALPRGVNDQAMAVKMMVRACARCPCSGHNT